MGFEVITPVIMKFTILCDVTPYNLVEIYQSFRRTLYIHFQGRWVIHAINHTNLCLHDLLVDLQIEAAQTAETSVNFCHVASQKIVHACRVTVLCHVYFYFSFLSSNYITVLGGYAELLKQTKVEACAPILSTRFCCLACVTVFICCRFNLQLQNDSASIRRN